MTQSRKTILKVILVPLIIGVIVTQYLIDPHVRELNKGQKAGSLIGLSNEFILGPMLGLQQAVAGALWVRADEFFHEGDYDAILPIVRMVTWLDPHQLDVYITGAWHLAYNFTDSSERSDRRYIPAAQKLLEEGDANNSHIYDIAFELGWQNTDKIKNFPRAQHWYDIATQRKRVDPGKQPEAVPTFVWHQLAHSLERQGKIWEAVGIWKKVLAMTEEKLKKEDPKNPEYMTRAVRDSERHNLELTAKRYFSRYKHAVDWTVDSKMTKSVNWDTGEPTPRDAYLATSAKEGVPIGSPRRPATVPPWDTAFDGQVTFPEPKVMMPKGQFNVGDGARVNIRLHDDNWREAKFTEFKFEIDQSQTIMQDQHSVRKTSWGRRIDMSKDPKMYGFHRPYYYLVYEFNPRATSPFIQDKFGWSGEGIKDGKYTFMDPSSEVPLKRIRKVFKISREQIMGQKPVTEADVISNAEYDRVVNSQQVASK
jgi:hypothetical protein